MNTNSGQQQQAAAKSAQPRQRMPRRVTRPGIGGFSSEPKLDLELSSGSGKRQQPAEHDATAERLLREKPPHWS